MNIIILWFSLFYRVVEEQISNFLVLVAYSGSNCTPYSGETGSAYAETDMRAMYNPTRMKLIAKVTEKLVSKIKSSCPQCKIPGFGVVDAVKGLPCEMCGLPTRSTLKHIYRCHKCNFIVGTEFPFNKRKEDPQHCDFCNP